MIEKCAACGFERKEHTYNGACYGVCGKFVERASNPVLVVETGSAKISRFMSHIMSNLDGEKDAEIAALSSSLADANAEIDRLRATLQIIAGTAADKLQATQALGVLANIGAKV